MVIALLKAIVLGIPLTLFALVAVIADPSLAAQESDTAALAQVTQDCVAKGGEPHNCDCVRTILEDEVLPGIATPEAGVLAAMFMYPPGQDRQAAKVIVEYASELETEERNQAVTRGATAQQAVEACMELEPETAADDTTSQDPAEPLPPEQTTPRARFIRQCAEENKQVELCTCLADQVQEKLTPGEFELMVDMRAAERRGDDPIKSIAEARGLTVDETRQALVQVSGQMSAAMMTVDPMSCMGTLRNDIQGRADE